VLNNRTQSIITKRLLRDNRSALRAATQRNNKVNLRQNRSKVNRCNEMEYKIAEQLKIKIMTSALILNALQNRIINQ